MWFVIGSRGANTAFEAFYRDVSASDWDLVTTDSEFKTWLMSKPPELKSCYPIRPGKFHLSFTDLRKMELSIYDNDLLYQFVEKNDQLWCDNKVNVPHVGEITTLNATCLTLLKKSHLKWEVHWDKNNNDFQWMKNQCDIENITAIEQLFYEKAYEKMQRVHINRAKHATTLKIM